MRRKRKGKNLRAITKLVNFHNDEVTPSHHEFGDVEFAWVPTTLTIAHLFAVDPHVERAIYPLEPQSALELILLVPGNVEAPLVYSRLVPVERHIRGVHRKRVHDVGVMGTAVARKLPHSGYPDVAPWPGRCVE
jgi:hypothetical protein